MSRSSTYSSLGAPNAAVGETVNLRADRSLFDDVVTGGVVAVRSLRIHPSFARLEAMNGQRWLAIVNDAGILPFVLGVAALFGGIFLYGGVGVAALVRKPASVLPLCVGGYITWQSARPFRGDPPAGAPLTARAVWIGYGALAALVAGLLLLLLLRLLFRRRRVR